MSAPSSVGRDEERGGGGGAASDEDESGEHAHRRAERSDAGYERGQPQAHRYSEQERNKHQRSDGAEDPRRIDGDGNAAEEQMCQARRGEHAQQRRGCGGDDGEGGISVGEQREQIRRLPTADGAEQHDPCQHLRVAFQRRPDSQRRQRHESKAAKTVESQDPHLANRASKLRGSRAEPHRQHERRQSALHDGQRAERAERGGAAHAHQSDRKGPQRRVAREEGANALQRGGELLPRGGASVARERRRRPRSRRAPSSSAGQPRRRKPSPANGSGRATAS
mmetsp:Transcript_17810/g.58609  ORF Transcript_17810/g.58609 Transcript_17810/m.58609 type:complete len:280 (+) Transcript_17810:293-1132(+)